jgi:hypothetical protein
MHLMNNSVRHSLPVSIRLVIEQGLPLAVAHPSIATTAEQALSLLVPSNLGTSLQFLGHSYLPELCHNEIDRTTCPLVARPTSHFAS